MAEIDDVIAIEQWRPSTPLQIPPNNIHGHARGAETMHMAAVAETDKNVTIAAK